MIIAAAQFSSRALDIEANVARMAGFVTEAGERGVSVVVFAELAVTGYELEAIVADQDRLTTAPDDPRLAPVRDACRAARVTAVVNCAGRRTGTGPTISSYVYGPDGELLTRYDKQHVTDSETAQGFVRGAVDGSFTLDGVGFGLAICYDAHFPETGADAAKAGCGVLLLSSLYGESGPESRSTVFPELARANGLYVLLANHSGRSGPYEGCGLSGVWEPSGAVATVAAGREEGLVLAEVGA
ncbi:carbon-nitrogen hydrolase family protein [Streptomyces olivoreticuli]